MIRDPLSLVYDALWDTLEAHRGFRDLVKEGNRVKFTGRNRDPLKEQVSVADLPEVRIVVASTPLDLNATSSTSFVTAVYEVGIATGDQRIDAVLFPVMWEIIRALSQEELGARMKSLEWDAATFVVTTEVGMASIGTSDVDVNRGIKGWSVVWPVSVKMSFGKAAISPVE